MKKHLTSWLGMAGAMLGNMPKLPKRKGNKYTPHQGKKERARRKKNASL